jgi:hypothetical protein
LPQPDAVASRQAVEPLDGRMWQLGIGRKVMAFDCTAVSTVTRFRSWPRNAPASGASRRLSASSNSSLLPSRLRQWLRSKRSRAQGYAFLERLSHHARDSSTVRHKINPGSGANVPVRRHALATIEAAIFFRRPGFLISPRLKVGLRAV